MKATRFASFVWFAALVTPALAVDLSKIDRTIARQPAYQDAPKYCLLVFGPEAKVRVWLVQEGDALYVDKNSNGDLTEPGERLPAGRFFKSLDPAYLEQRSVQVGDIREGDLRHTRLTLSQYRVRPGFARQWAWQKQLETFIQENPGAVIWHFYVSVERRPGPRDKVRIAGRIWQGAGADPEGYLQFADRPQDAPVVHFNGPLQMGLLCRQVLKRGDKPGDLIAVVGTAGLGKGAFAVIDPTGLISEDVHPVAVIRFPHQDPRKAPIRAKVILPYRVEVTHLYGPVRVPDAAGEGAAKVTLSFDDCEEVRVRPAESPWSRRSGPAGNDR